MSEPLVLNDVSRADALILVEDAIGEVDDLATGPPGLIVEVVDFDISASDELLAQSESCRLNIFRMKVRTERVAGLTSCFALTRAKA
jgi:hypothetical protein